MKKKSKKNIPVMVNSIIALVCLILGFFQHWLYVIPAVILMLINWKLLGMEKE